MPQPMILVGNRVNYQDYDSEDMGIYPYPRQDYYEIAHRLTGVLFGYDLPNTFWYRWIRRLESQIKFDLLETLLAFKRVDKHNVVLSTSEKFGIPFAAISQILGPNIPHIVICHKLSSGRKVPFFETWKLYRTFSHLICVCTAQVKYAIHELRIPEERIDFVYDKVDHRYFKPQLSDTDNYILAVGQEQRDYQTLIKAIQGTDIELRIVASSRWTNRQIDRNRLGEARVYSDIPFTELRELYAHARLVILPLFDVDYAAGVNTLLEAMSMGKPVIVSRSRGISDYVVDGETGIYVPSGDSDALRQTLSDVWNSPQTIKRLGENARQFIEDGVNLDGYVDRICSIVSRYIEV